MNVLFKINLLEDSKCQTGFRDRVPRPLHEVLELCGSQTSEENFSHQFSKQNDEYESLHVDDGHAGKCLANTMTMHIFNQCINVFII